MCPTDWLCGSDSISGFLIYRNDYLTTWVKYIPIHTACTLILMFAFKLYRSMWRFASFDELSRTSIVCAISMALHIVGTTVVFQRMPISYYVMGGILQYILITGIRFPTGSSGC